MCIETNQLVQFYIAKNFETGSDKIINICTVNP